MHPFQTFIQQYTEISIEDWNKINVCLVRKVFEKESIILEEGKVCRYLYFLESGLLRFFIWKEGESVTKYFTEVPYCFTSQKSFTNQQAAKENIQALEKSIVWQMTYEDAQNLLQINSWNTFIRKLIQEVQAYTEEILEAIQTETAENRYKQMLESNDSLLQRVPLKYLASYLGIAPQSLSRIRKNLMTKERT